jgi:hypothetical protein
MAGGILAAVLTLQSAAPSDPPACDLRRWGRGLPDREAFVARFPADADINTLQDTVLVGAASHLCRPSAIAFDSTGKLYLSDPGHGDTPWVKVYDPSRGRSDAFVRAFPFPDSSATDAGAEDRAALSRVTRGFVFDSRGNAYGTAGDEIVVFAPGTSPPGPPIRKIAGPDTFLRRPRDRAIGPGDTLYVLNVFGHWRCSMMPPLDVTVAVFPPDASGNVEPARLLVVKAAGSGPSAPGGLAVDGKGAVYISFEHEGIAVYPPGARGRVAPVRRLALRKTVTYPTSLAISSDGSLYVVGYPHPTQC